MSQARNAQRPAFRKKCWALCIASLQACSDHRDAQRHICVAQDLAQMMAQDLAQGVFQKESKA